MQTGDLLFSTGVNSENPGLGRDEQSGFGGTDGVPVRQPQNRETFRRIPGFTAGGGDNIAQRRRNRNTGDRSSDLFDESNQRLGNILRNVLLIGANTSTDARNSANAIMDHFMSGQGGVFENNILGTLIKPNDGRSGQTVNDMLQDIQENLCNLANEEVCPPVDQQDIADRIQNITRPNFGFQNPRLFSQLGGTQGIEVTKGGNGNLQVAIFDTFGVDEADVAVRRNVVLEFGIDQIQARLGLAAQWILQHQRGRKPMVQKVPLDMNNLPPLNFNNCN